MNKKELINKIAENVDGMTKKDISLIVDVAFEEIVKSVAAGNSVKIAGFGTFSSTERAARECPNPQKPGEKIKVAASKAPKFKAGKNFKETVNA